MADKKKNLPAIIGVVAGVAVTAAVSFTDIGKETIYSWAAPVCTSVLEASAPSEPVDPAE